MLKWHAEDLLKEAIENIDDESVFSPDQIRVLKDSFEMIAQAIEAQSGALPKKIQIKS